MTQQYIIGQFSSLLAELQADSDERLVGVDDLRRAVESSPLSGLPQLAHDAVDLIDTLCWDALERGQQSGFRRYANAAVALREFTASAELLP